MFCKNCGYEIKENASFCTKCGTQVEKNFNRKLSKKRISINLIAIIIFNCIIIGLVLCLLFILVEKNDDSDKNIKITEDVYIEEKSSQHDIKNEERESEAIIENTEISAYNELEQINIEECDELLKLVGDMLDVFFDYNYNESHLSIIDRMNSICKGEKDEILVLLGSQEHYEGDTNARLPSSFFYPEKRQCEVEGHVADVCLTQEELNEIAYSLSGVDNLFDDYADGEHIQLGTGGGFGGGYYLENPSAEYIGNNTWNIKADVYYSNEFDDISQLSPYDVADISFQIVRDEMSCYDGYRIIHVQSFQTINWSETFYNYLMRNNNYYAESDGTFDYNMRYDIKQYFLFYLDDDGIPEIFVKGISEADGSWLLYYYNGDIYEQQLSRCTFVPKKGVLLNSYGKMESYGDEILKLEEGKLQTVAVGNIYFKRDEEANPILDEDGNIIYLEGSQWNGKEALTSKQYDELYNLTLSDLNVNKNEFRECLDEEFYVGDIDLLLFSLPQ